MSNTARRTGILFVIATVAILLATAIEPGGALTAGALLELIAAFSSVGIAVSMYPVLQTSSPALALGSVVFRAMEAIMYMVAVVHLLSRRDQAALEREHAVLAGVFAFCVGAAMYSYAFLRTRLVPRWLSAWGLGAIVLMLAACFLATWSGRPVTEYKLLVLPIAVQEMVFAAWLLTKGFSSARWCADPPRSRCGVDRALDFTS
jgi:hypothetical protein